MNRPWISTNFAISADGKISSVLRQATGWTSATDHERLIELRRGVDAILVGRATLEADQMTLTVKDQVKQPLRCIVTSGLGSIADEHPLWSRPGGPIHWVVMGDGQTPVPSGVQEVYRGSLTRYFSWLKECRGVEHLHCEGGGFLMRQLVEQDLVDEVNLTLAGHTLFGGTEAPTLLGGDLSFLSESRKFSIHSFHASVETNECFLSYRCRR